MKIQGRIRNIVKVKESEVMKNQRQLLIVGTDQHASTSKKKDACINTIQLKQLKKLIRTFKIGGNYAVMGRIADGINKRDVSLSTETPKIE